MKKAISLVDGRNEKLTQVLQDYFSEEALNFFRLGVEIRWLFLLSNEDSVPLRKFTSEEEKILNDIINNFTDQDADRIKEIEKTTNHDVKAVELFIKEKIKDTSLADIAEWVHFSCTSEDVNNISWALILKQATEEVMIPELENIINFLNKTAKDWKAIPMLSRTHGQPATPTTAGKEILVFAQRLKRQLAQFKKQEYLAKCAGATGNFAAHSVALPDTDWLIVSQKFIENFGLTWNPVITQIESHDFVAEIAHLFCRINTILIDFCRDIWTMISLEYIRQKVVQGEVGSSVMPHKVNPIDFENAEGNFGVANSLFTHFAAKLPISRLQRDLSDSTVFRSIGTAYGHTLISLKNLQKGLSKLEINQEKMSEDLEKHSEVLAEAVQTVMRKNGVENAYEKLKALTRGKDFSMESYKQFVSELSIDEDDKKRLLELTADKYTGFSEKIVDKFAD